MHKGLQTRLIIHEILYELKNNFYNYDDVFKKKTTKYKLVQSDKNMIAAVVLTSMRNDIHIIKIIKKYVKKKLLLNQYLLLLSSITQILLLEFKEYAVVNSTVEIAKNPKINVHSGFINATLKKIIKDKNFLKEVTGDFTNLPKWFTQELLNWNPKEKNLFLKNIREKPNLHIVFKNNNLLKKFNYENNKITDVSCSVNNIGLINKFLDYDNGNWWVQDFSSMLPINLIKENIKGNIIDICSAPGGKAFQILSLNLKLQIVEKNPKRANILKENLKRLNFKNKVMIVDALDLSEDQKYDFVVIDAPCSSVGTVRRNPEIFFRNKKTILKKTIKIQKDLLEKGKKLLKKNGTIIYMVCSFLEKECDEQIKNFLITNHKFKIEKFESSDKYNNLIDKSGFIKIIPRKFLNINIDGFFAAKLRIYD